MQTFKTRPSAVLPCATAPWTFAPFPDFGWAEEGLVINGKDPSNHWGNPPRPTRDLITT